MYQKIKPKGAGRLATLYSYATDGDMDKKLHADQHAYIELFLRASALVIVSSERLYDSNSVGLVGT